MISFIANTLRSVIFAFLLNDYLKRTYPKKYDDLLVRASFNAIYAFSVIQIKLKNIQRYIYIKNPRILELLESYNKNVIDFVLDGDIILSTTISSQDTDHPKKFDFIIHTDSKTANKRLLTELNIDEKYDYEVSEIKFILVELKICDNTYKIDLRSDTYNFYVVGNCFTKQFFIYYLKQILKVDKEIKHDSVFIIKIIDQNVDTVDIEFTDKNESILLEKNGYKLLNTTTNNIINNNEEKE
jgi:hypothetical protein